MKTVFVVEYNDNGSSQIKNEVRSENEWVLKGEGVATIKFDGTAAFFKDGQLYKRFDRKLTKKFTQIKKRKGADFVAEDHMFRTLPEGAIPCEEKPDPVTHHHPHWVPVDDSADNRYFHEALAKNPVLKDGSTYELVGEKVQANPENVSGHELWEHGSKVVDVELSFEGLKAWLKENYVEGLVFHHPDGRKAKLRRRDFGFTWNDEHSKR